MPRTEDPPIKATLRLALEVLKEAEWAGRCVDGNCPVCPSCQSPWTRAASERHGGLPGRHAPDCRLLLAITRIRATMAD